MTLEDVAVAEGWRALPGLVAEDAARRVLIVENLRGAPQSLDAPVALVARGRWLAEALPGRVFLVRPGRGALAPDEPLPLTRGELTDDEVVHVSTVEDVLAAFAAGRTVIAPDTPALREVVTDGHDGLLVPASDRKASRSARERLDADRVLLHFLRHNARRTAQGWPSQAQQATMLEAVLRRVAREPEPAPAGALPRPSLWRRLRHGDAARHIGGT